MKRSLSLVALILSACMVDTPIVEGTADRLGADLGTWCDSFCANYGECGLEIEFEQEVCVEDCVEYFGTTFANKGDVCSEAGLRAMDCIEQASCAELDEPNACDVRVEETLCAGEHPVVCNAGENGVFPQGAPFQCELTLNECSDSREYSLVCAGPGDPPDCHCLIDGESTGRFSPSRLVCPTDLEAIQICGWPIDRAETPDAPAPPSLGVIGDGGKPANGVECIVEYLECSDGHNYVVDCGGSPGDVLCECSIDGDPMGVYQSPNGICPFLSDPFNGVVAANYACGFNLTPIIPD